MCGFPRTFSVILWYYRLGVGEMLKDLARETQRLLMSLGISVGEAATRTGLDRSVIERMLRGESIRRRSAREFAVGLRQEVPRWVHLAEGSPSAGHPAAHEMSHDHIHIISRPLRGVLRGGVIHQSASQEVRGIPVPTKAIEAEYLYEVADDSGVPLTHRDDVLGISQTIPIEPGDLIIDGPEDARTLKRCEGKASETAEHVVWLFRPTP